VAFVRRSSLGGRVAPDPSEAVFGGRICEVALPLALPAGGASPPGPPEKGAGREVSAGWSCLRR